MGQLFIKVVPFVLKDLQCMKYLIYLCAIFLLIACNLSKKNTSNKSQYDNTLIKLQKTRCYGKCPVYTITIHGNGQAIYFGKENVGKIGKYEKKLEQTEIGNLIKAFEDANFFEFKDEYTAKITDRPTTYITYTVNEKTKRIRDYYGAPAELKKLEKMVEVIANSEGWDRVNISK